jgi:hypothetical protein
MTEWLHKLWIAEQGQDIAERFDSYPRLQVGVPEMTLELRIAYFSLSDSSPVFRYYPEKSHFLETLHGQGANDYGGRHCRVAC